VHYVFVCNIKYFTKVPIKKTKIYNKKISNMICYMRNKEYGDSLLYITQEN